MTTENETRERERQNWQHRLRDTSLWKLISITVSFSFVITIAPTWIYQIYIEDSGWKVDQAEASTTYSVNIAKDLKVENDLEVLNDIRILGSVLDIAGSPCEEEGRSPEDSVRLCYDGEEQKFKLSRNGGIYEDIQGRKGDPGAQGPTGPLGPKGATGAQGT